MTEIAKGISVDLSSVSAVERKDSNCIIHIYGESFKWNVSYETALQLILIQKRIQANVP